MTTRLGTGDKLPEGCTEVFRYYQTKQNSDQTEGRGNMVVVSESKTEFEAWKDARGRGTMGVGDGEVWEIIICETEAVDQLAVFERSLYGYGKMWDGKWGYGWYDYREAPKTDPEYEEYKRLKKKFEG